MLGDTFHTCQIPLFDSLWKLLVNIYFHLFVVSECSSIITTDFNSKNQTQTKNLYLEILDIPFEKAFIRSTLKQLMLINIVANVIVEQI